MCSVDSSPAPKPSAGKAAHRKGHHHAAGVFAEDCGGASDISGDVQADTTLKRRGLTDSYARRWVFACARRLYFPDSLFDTFKC